MELAKSLIDEILNDVVTQDRFYKYYRACNTNASLDDLLDSAKKHFPSFACEKLKRKYSIPTSESKKIKDELLLASKLESSSKFKKSFTRKSNFESEGILSFRL